MINAKEAKRRTLLNTYLKKHMTVIEKGIIDATERGNYYTTVYFNNNLEQNLVDILIETLVSLGYVAQYKPSKPLPTGCPSDQWHSSATLKVSWEG